MWYSLLILSTIFSGCSSIPLISSKQTSSEAQGHNYYVRRISKNKHIIQCGSFKQNELNAPRKICPTNLICQGGHNIRTLASDEETDLQAIKTEEGKVYHRKNYELICK